jgi:hypothetical protein
MQREGDRQTDRQDKAKLIASVHSSVKHTKTMLMIYLNNFFSHEPIHKHYLHYKSMEKV